MGKHISEQWAANAQAAAFLPSETGGWGEDQDEYSSSVLRFEDGATEFRITGSLTDLKQLLLDAIVAVEQAQQRDYANITGFNIGDEVKVGGGSTYWKVTGFGALASPDGKPVIAAHLRQMGGYNNTTVLVDRLRVP